MKVFSFRLETLLHLRELAKDRAVAEYGVAISEKEQAERALEERKREMEELRQEIGRRRNIGFSGSEQDGYNRSLERVKEAIVDSNSKLEESKKIVNAKRELYLNADSEFKSMLKLKEKNFLALVMLLSLIMMNYLVIQLMIKVVNILQYILEKFLTKK